MRRLIALAAVMAAITSPVMAQGTIRANPDSPVTKPPVVKTDSPGPFFKNCTEARGAGYRRMRRGDPGYAPHLDRDNDGIACE
jgi:Excalibur calcium-binding domain